MSTLTSERARCIATLPRIKEFFIGIRENKILFVARTGGDSTPSVERCFMAPFEFEPRIVAGAKKAWIDGGTRRGGGTVIAIDESFITIGPQALVESSLSATARSDTPLSSIHLSADQYLLVDMRDERRLDEANHVRAAVAVNQERTSGLLDIDFPDVASAQSLSPGDWLDSIARDLSKTEKGAYSILNRIGANVRLQRTDKHVAIMFEAKGAPEQQAHDLGDLSALVCRQVERVIAANEWPQVQGHLVEIGGALSAHVRKGNTLPALPPVPTLVPKGASVALTDNDWNRWSAINFSLATSRFQFEVKPTAPADAAEVIARGDTRGDGKITTFRMRVSLSKSTTRQGGHWLEVGPIERVDPAE